MVVLMFIVFTHFPVNGGTNHGKGYVAINGFMTSMLQWSNELQVKVCLEHFVLILNLSLKPLITVLLMLMVLLWQLYIYIAITGHNTFPYRWVRNDLFIHLDSPAVITLWCMFYIISIYRYMYTRWGMRVI